MNYELLEVPSVTLFELLAAATGAGFVAAGQVLASDGLHGLAFACVACRCLLLSGIGKLSS